MNRKSIMKLINDLANSQGFYARLLRGIETMIEEEPYEYEELMLSWEKQNFKSPVDFIMYVEG